MYRELFRWLGLIPLAILCLVGGILVNYGMEDEVTPSDELTVEVDGIPLRSDVAAFDILLNKPCTMRRGGKILEVGQWDTEVMVNYTNRRQFTTRTDCKPESKHLISSEKYNEIVLKFLESFAR